MSNFFNSKYPIVCASMNQVYSYSMIVACAESGITPGSFFQMIPEQDLKKYLRNYYETNILISIYHFDLYKIDKITNLCNLGVKFIEVIVLPNNIVDELAIASLKYLKNHGIKIVFKYANNVNLKVVDALVVKGSEAAGNKGNNSLQNEFDRIKNIFPNTPLLVSGGLYNSAQIKHYLDNGASGAIVGTVFAASEESNLCQEAKRKIIEKSSADLSELGSSKKNALVLSNPDSFEDSNFTNELYQGVNTGVSGVLYSGTAIDHIHTIKSVAQIVKELTKYLS